MAGSTSNLDLISTSQAQKEVTANALFDASSPATTFGRRASTSAALTWGYYGGAFLASTGLTQIANGTLALTANATNYVEADADGVVSKNTTAFTSGRLALYTVVTGASTVTSYTDWRSSVNVPLVSVGTTQPFDVHAFYPGVPTANALVLRVPVARPVAFAANFAGSFFAASANATASTVFTVKKNGTSIGTVTIAAGGMTATFATSGGAAQSLTPGDVLSITAPGTPDATLADPGFVLAGTR